MAANPSILLAIFDIAGTLMEDTGVLVRSFYQAFEHSGISATEAEIEEWRGAAKRDVIRHFVSKHLGQGSSRIEDRVDETYSTFRRLLEENYRNEAIKPIAGSEDTINWLRSRHILIATTTGFYREVRDLVLKKLGCSDIVIFVLEYIPHSYQVHFNPSSIVIEKLNIEQVVLKPDMSDSADWKVYKRIN